MLGILRLDCIIVARACRLVEYPRQRRTTCQQTTRDHFEILFDYASISLWEQDYSEIKQFFDGLRAGGVESLVDYLEEHPEEIENCIRRLRVIRVNRETVLMLGAASEQELLAHLDQVFRDEMRVHFRAELLALWNEALEWSGEGVNYRLDGKPLHIRLRWRFLPGHEQDWQCVLVSIEIITLLKKAEEYLRYLGTHDVMTGLYNCAFFEETLASLEANRRDPVAVIVIDLNNLKPVNDRFGHQAKDKLIRRAAEVLNASILPGQMTARIGGDEFALLLPGAGLGEAHDLIERIQSLVAMNNKFYREPELSFLVGAAVSEPGLSLEKVISLADDEMYRNKGLYHRRRKEDLLGGIP